MKKHNITYYTIAGENRTWDTMILFEFFQRLSELMEDPYVVQGSISFHTETIKQEEPVLVSFPASKEEIERERELLKFRRFD